MEESPETISTKKMTFSTLRFIGQVIILFAIIISVRLMFYYNETAQENRQSAVNMYLALGAMMIAIFIGSLVWGFAIRRERKTIGVSKIEEIVHRIFFYPSALISMLIVALIILTRFSM
jgi:hypothetical protein